MSRPSPVSAAGDAAPGLPSIAPSEGETQGDATGDSNEGRESGEEQLIGEDEENRSRDTRRIAGRESPEDTSEGEGEADCFDVSFYSLPLSLRPEPALASPSSLQRGGRHSSNRREEEERKEREERKRRAVNRLSTGELQVKRGRYGSSVGSDVTAAASSVATLVALPSSSSRLLRAGTALQSSSSLSISHTPKCSSLPSSPCSSLCRFPRSSPPSPSSPSLPCCDSSSSADSSSLPCSSFSPSACASSGPSCSTLSGHSSVSVQPRRSAVLDCDSLSPGFSLSALADLFCSAGPPEPPPSFSSSFWGASSEPVGFYVRSRAERESMLAHLLRPRVSEARREKRKYRQPYEKDGLLRATLNGCTGRRVALVLTQGGAVEGRFVRCIDRREVARRPPPVPFFRQRMQTQTCAGSGETQRRRRETFRSPARSNPATSATATLASSSSLPSDRRATNGDARRLRSLSSASGRGASPPAAYPPLPGPPLLGCTSSGKCGGPADAHPPEWPRAPGSLLAQRREETGGRRDDPRLRRFQRRRAVSRIVLDDAVVYRHAAPVFASAAASVSSGASRQAQTRSALAERGGETAGNSLSARSESVGVAEPGGARRGDGGEVLASVCVKTTGVAFILGTEGSSVRGLEARVKKSYIDAVKNKVFDRSVRLGAC
uniref:Arginine N-methyltransferase, putative n=1 Tax=Toxoplasma gondii (strain ATCC 50861 / VEG) TaxID=432359 RepID=A0A0F7UQX9_TOXGV|nr:TPA: arginine N-methyltransferase, putative [Toxoplasma gondii VEG]